MEIIWALIVLVMVSVHILSEVFGIFGSDESEGNSSRPEDSRGHLSRGYRLPVMDLIPVRIATKTEQPEHSMQPKLSKQHKQSKQPKQPDNQRWRVLIPTHPRKTPPPKMRITKQSSISMRNWSKDQVANFIREIGVDEVWMEYACIALKVPVDGATFCKLQAHDFESMGIHPIHARVLAREVWKHSRTNSRRSTSVGSARSGRNGRSSERTPNPSRERTPKLSTNFGTLGAPTPEIKPNLSISINDIPEFTESNISPAPAVKDESSVSLQDSPTEKDLTPVGTAGLIHSFRRSFSLIRNGDASERKGHKRTRSKSVASPTHGRDFSARFYSNPLVRSAETTHSTQTNIQQKLRQKYLQIFGENISTTEHKDSIPLAGRSEDRCKILQIMNNTLVHEEKNQYGTEDEREIDPRYTYSTHRRGFLKQLFHIGKPLEPEELLSFDKSIVAKSLLKINRQDDSQAIQMFKNVQGFMGDRSSAKEPYAHAQKIVKNALLSPQSMRDEVFLQICKQVHKHPNLANCIEGWNLLIICLQSFSPSRHVELYSRIKGLMKSTSSREIQERGIIAQKLLKIITVTPKREEVPLKREIEAVRKLQLVKISIFSHSESKGKATRSAVKIDVDAFTTVAEAEILVSRRLGIKMSAAFGLFEANDQCHNLLHGSRRLLDVVSSWKGSLKEAILSRVEAKRGRRASSSFSSVPGYICSSGRGVQAKPRYHFVLFQAKLVPPLDRQSNVGQKEIDLLYNQAIREIFQSRGWSLESDLIEQLLAIRLKASGMIAGNNDKEIDIPPNWIPKHVKGENSTQRFSLKVISRCPKSISMQEAKREFLTHCFRHVETFGSQFFRVELKEQSLYLPDEINIGISMKGVFFQSLDTSETLRRFALEDIAGWGCTEIEFTMLLAKPGVTLVMITADGRILDDLLQKCVQLTLLGLQSIEPMTN
mmetsp:Transcript_8172/g.15163  ORF Transcript_8172/g.15163 Transcript_8172/m.15163 type:complete len:939 (+) Transcript_8172:128-2944(+)